MKNKYNLNIDDFSNKELFTFEKFFIYTMISFILVIFILGINLIAYTSNEYLLFIASNLTLNALILASILVTSINIVNTMQRYRSKLNSIRTTSELHKELDDKLHIFSKNKYVCIAALVYRLATIFILLVVSHTFEFGTAFYLTTVYATIRIPYCINSIRNCLLYNHLLNNDTSSKA